MTAVPPVPEGAETALPVSGRVSRINGPLVEIEGLAGVAVMDTVEVGETRLTAEVISVRPERVTAQVYDYTGGMAVGAPAQAQHRPLSAHLGPWLLGSTFDGLLRPLAGAGVWLEAGAQRVRAPRRWDFRPVGACGQAVQAGGLIGVVALPTGFEHRIVVPAGVSGSIDWVGPAGEVGEDEPVAVVAGVPLPLGEVWPVRQPRPVTSRLPLGEPLVTGQRVIDLMFPIAKGGAAAVPGGFGTGKTMLLQQILKWSHADVIVFVGCGERGNELADALADLTSLADPATGRRLTERTVVIANTSNMPVMAREASIYTGMTVAEYYRDMGYDAVLLADSTSRWAEALREFASRKGELPVEEGYPAGLASSLAAFYERAGRVVTRGGREGSVTVIGAVSPPGGDTTEPVTVQTERFVRCVWSLDRDLAYARHNPAVTWRRSFSRDAAAVGAWKAAAGDPEWGDDRQRAIALLAQADRLEPMLELVGLTGLPDTDRMVLLAARILREAVLQQNALSANDAVCSPPKQAALLHAAFDAYDRLMSLVARGVDAAIIEQADLSDLSRIREETAPDDHDAVRVAAKSVLDRFEADMTAILP